ncbi:MAG TPA: 50S ribosomal protein L23 [Cyanobacteria bacterium UBA8530]|nr:50S ribosomal protein L23 [Cyanobacteria bacterium UBA8530]
MSDLYGVIKRPLVTEKNAVLNEQNKYCFEVAKQATKIDIARAAELLFKVKVVGVNTTGMKAKKKRVGARIGMTKSSKKAIVTLAAGHQIDIYGS